MKNYLILAMILMAGMTAYPQATRSARESKSEKGSTRTEASKRSESKAESRSRSDNNQVRTAPERSRSEAVKSSSQRQSNESASRQETVRPRMESRSSNERSSNRSSGEAVRRSEQPERTVTRSYEKSGESRNAGEAVRRGQEQVRVQSNTSRSNESGNAVRRSENQVARPENRSGQSSSVSRTSRDNGGNNDREIRVNTNSATRVFREGNGTLTREDGKVIRHQNDEVFTSKKYRLDYDNYEHLRRSDEFRRDYRDWDRWYNHRCIRVVNHYHNNYVPLPWEVRRSRYYYRVPGHIDLIWTPLLFHRFMYYYPAHLNWEMEFGTPIETISANDAEAYAGTVRRIYGKVDEVYYSPEDENYILYIGAPFPYQDVSVVIPKHVARNISMSPKWYFENEFVWVVGLINMWEGKPEIIVRDEEQIRRY